MSRAAIASLACSGVVLLGVGLWLDTWWTIAGGVLSLTGAAWLVTE